MHLLKLFDKICKYEMDPAGIVEDIERTLFGLQTDGQTDGRIDGQTKWNQYTPLNFVGMGYNDCHLQTTFSYGSHWMKISMLVQISLKFVPKIWIDKKS